MVAHDYHMGEWQPDDNDTLSVPEKTVGNPGMSYVYLWYVPANAAGKWQISVPVAGQTLAVDLDFEPAFSDARTAPRASMSAPRRCKARAFDGEESPSG